MDTSRLTDVGKCALAAGKVDQALTILTAASVRSPADPQPWVTMTWQQYATRGPSRLQQGHSSRAAPQLPVWQWLLRTTPGWLPPEPCPCTGWLP
ncbi:hypothetical protein HaLaN_26605 [Haematococcus lacustris]|uniref:Uncharacterized protein n=1 Tax=Haematococcus lacustris TaxID=44745 RepID=A0A6A0A6N3_HAELA|nr:hypothetical protein HaLaN_26605 [Haematococcus lacustris]